VFPDAEALETVSNVSRHRVGIINRQRRIVYSRDGFDGGPSRRRFVGGAALAR